MKAKCDRIMDNNHKSHAIIGKIKHFSFPRQRFSVKISYFPYFNRLSHPFPSIPIKPVTSKKHSRSCVFYDSENLNQ